MPLKCAVQAISHICIQGAIQSVAEGTRVAASCAPSARDVTRGGHPPTLRMSPRPVLGGAAPVAPDVPATHILRARVVDRDRPALPVGRDGPGRLPADPGPYPGHPRTGRTALQVRSRRLLRLDSNALICKDESTISGAH